MPSKAVQYLSGPGLAPDTEEVADLMEKKFAKRPSHQAASVRTTALPANTLSEEAVLRAIQAFSRGAGAGPSGLRPDFLRQLVGNNNEQDQTLSLLTSLSQLLADGAPGLARFRPAF